MWHFLGAYIYSPQKDAGNRSKEKSHSNLDGETGNGAMGKELQERGQLLAATPPKSPFPTALLTTRFPQVLTPARATKPLLPAGSQKGLSFQRMLMGPSLQGSCKNHHSCFELKRAALLLGHAMAKFYSTSPFVLTFKFLCSSSKMFPDLWRGW